MTQDRDRIGEIQDRLRRIETRLTKYMQERGFETQVQKCVFEEDSLHLPSLDVRYRDILTAIPKEYRGELRLWHQGMEVGILVVIP
jgi:hypothetical protein